MLDIRVSVEGDKVVLAGLNSLAQDLPRAVDRGLTRIAKGVHREAYDWLSGPGRKKVTKTTRKRGQSDSLGGRPGSYPVPVLTGHLRRALDWLRPNTTKSADGHTFTTGPHEAMVYNSAEYARPIHEGWGSSSTYGPRRFTVDALNRFNQGGRGVEPVETEVQTEIRKRGLNR
ncbi:MAG: hypothetical protein WC291_08300 [Thermodesulfovibrionales bacterium]|jgi:hypothetical protein